MIGQLWSQLRHQRARVLALLAAIAVATASFTVLTGRVAVQRLELRGAVAAGGRGSYDILVRPAGTRTALEASQSLVRPNFLSGQFGGISEAQDQTIAKLAGVELAAPIAMIGYVLQTVTIPVDITDQLSAARRQLFTASVQRSTDRGLTRIAQPDVSYTYLTPDKLQTIAPTTPAAGYGIAEAGADGRTTLVCPTSTAAVSGPFSTVNQRTSTCWSSVNGPSGAGWTVLPHGHVGVLIRWTFPFLLAAIDPLQESRLVGLDAAVSQGSYLSGQPGKAPSGKATVPVLIADRTTVDDQDTVQVNRLPAAAASAYGAGLDPEQIDALLARQPGVPVRTATITAAEAYQALLAQYLSGSKRALVDDYWTASPTDYAAGPDGVLHPSTVTNPDQVWRSDVRDQGYAAPPPDAAGIGFRQLQPHTAIATGRRADDGAPQLATIGAFDAARIGDPAGAASAYNVSALAGADARTRQLLGNQSLLPNGDLAGYLLSAPTMLTSLDQIGAFTDPAIFTDVQPGAPISAVRVRVAGVTGTDELSRERVRAVAAEIHRSTGLDVDPTLGSSPTTRTVELPAGSSGRPALLLAEPWQREGVVAAILSALDRKSLLLFVLVLAVCGLFIANATAASVRLRRTELSILSCLGWRRDQLLRLLLYETALIAGVAGVAGMVLSWIADDLTAVHLAPVRAALTVPAALVVALLSALPPAWRASAPPPLFTLPESFDGGRIGPAAGSMPRLALANLLRVPGRTALGVIAVAVGTAGLTLLVAITLAFHGGVVGTLLGDAVSLDARRIDYLAVGLTVLLAGFAVADVVYLNVRDRRAELAVLHAVGWTDWQLWRLVMTEAGLTGAAGAVSGGAAGLIGAGIFAGSFSAELLATALLAATLTTAVTMLAALLPTSALRRLPAALLLSRD